MIILDGKSASEKICSQLKADAANLNPLPKLDIILVGDNPASVKYTELKQAKAISVGIGGTIHRLPESSTTEQVLSLISELNQNNDVTALMVQLPLPEHINTHQVLAAIDPKKDGDGLTPYNLGLMFHDDPSAVVTATALGIIKLFETYQIDISGKNAVIINNTSLVGLPLAALFNNRHATATICHKYTQNIEQATLSADIIVSATGVKNLITANMVKSGAVVVDVGGGDVDFENVKVKCSYITPTFGGVGPMTVACLLRNTYELYSRQRSI